MQSKVQRTLALAAGLLASGLLFSAPAGADATPEMLSNTCAGCHGTNGVSAGPGMPSIAGMPANLLKGLMKEYKEGKRPATVMDRIAGGYSDAEIDAIATHLSKQKWLNAKAHPNSKMGTPVDAKLAKQGKELQKKCEKCHENAGRGQEDDTARLAGQWVDYLLLKMADYKDPELRQKIPQPEKMAKQMDEKTLDELKALAHFYASQTD
ncbi:MAG: c-type cytochrome [Magnetococcales bacterium]|nr:c-type cytochrome [Magnetococcales bacterium]